MIDLHNVYLMNAMQAYQHIPTHRRRQGNGTMQNAATHIQYALRNQYAVDIAFKLQDTV